MAAPVRIIRTPVYADCTAALFTDAIAATMLCLYRGSG